MANGRFLLLLGIAAVMSLLPVLQADAKVWIPDDGYSGFYDSNGIYQVVGAVKNSKDFPVIPIVTVTVLDGTDTVSKDFEYISIMPGREMPFKFAFPQVREDDPIPDVKVSYIRGIHSDHSISVIYDDSLIVHPDGHITGKIINTGSRPAADVMLLAIVHGHDHKVLDMGRNILPIKGMQPGEVRDFAMYPDPSVQSDVWYYSCFAIGDPSVITLNAQRNNQNFAIRYDSGILISYPEFDSSGRDLSFWVNPGWPFQTLVNFEFPMYSANEKFEVSFNGQRIDSIQSTDNMGNWHVAFSIEDQSSGRLVVSGFDPDAILSDTAVIPDWVRTTAAWWSQNKIPDEDFASGIEFLIDAGLIIVPDTEQTSESQIPDWVRTTAGWWSQRLISDEEFVAGIQYLVSSGIIIR